MNPNPLIPPDPNVGDPDARLRAMRYQTIRKHLGSVERGTLTNDTWLLAQIALVMCDALEELQGLRTDMSQLAADIEHMIVHWKPSK